MSEFAYRFGIGWHIPGPPARPVQYAMRRIAEEVAADHSLHVRDLTGQSRVKHICAARFEAMFRIYEERHPDGRRVYSMTQLGRFFNRDHTTILNALRRYEERSGYGVRRAA